MATTRTPGITVLADGRRFIDKRYLGVRIGLRVGSVTQEQAEERLQTEMARVECDVVRKAHARPSFTDCAARYVAQSRGKRSIDVIKWHVTLLRSYIGDLELQQVHDATLEPFAKARRGLPPARARPRPTLSTLWSWCGSRNAFVRPGRWPARRPSWSGFRHLPRPPKAPATPAASLGLREVKGVKQVVRGSVSTS